MDDGLPTVVPVALGVALGGISTFGSDIAGYQNTNSPASSKELFFRWTELGALSPVMRTHHGSYPKLNWSFQSDADTLAHWKRYAMLHIALAPFFRTLAQNAHDTGIAIMRPLAVEFPDDAASWPIDDEYMLGDALLVAPVMTEGATARAVHLPPGTWFPWSGGAPVTSDLTADAPTSEIPVYARAGAIVPTYPDGVMTLVTEPSPDRVVYAFAGADGSFAENGVTYDMKTGGTATTIAWNGTTLAACGATPAAPCETSDADSVRAYVTGSGTLEVQGIATITVGGAAPQAKEQIVVRH